MRGRYRCATALNDGIDAARMPILVSMADQYMAPVIVHVGSVDFNMRGMKVIRMMDEIQALIAQSSCDQWPFANGDRLYRDLQ